ncbi:phosphonate ABC transporter [Synechococcus sp. CS-602]|uniref:PhnE/PtxC family ABC transporter permease n=1 Tax=Synechococcaceae TaxID=1890426 RepID=UPI0008FF2BAB|nr:MULTISPECIES: ABC transporter permease subunit [Synechococcaceae]MCT4365461.1 phosphonate ABC transporter [Candidatus Regnicoccus frigidus MAG-AL1]APD47507.1 phosphonate ABC transporter [Synechococcus sp. SynAce01]MCT0202527.1 phosphonate ABC transporter [Synechococcus sp. CS-603]MCT0204331.1 phosphonate ABC transporter [Synechococcus sp. CS-602]MCT0247173.1 phosphonate ABC transporter [Synechococcus sp. CS-601]
MTTTAWSWRPAAPLLPLLPALALLPLLLVLPGLIHGGGWELVAQFAAAAITPSLDPLLLRTALAGLGITVGIALLGWALSLALGLVGGVLSSRIVWRTWLGVAWPASAIRRFLAVPRSIHELLWGLLLLQLLGLKPAVAVLAIAIPYAALVARVVSDLLDALPTAPLQALRSGGAPAGAALLTALGPALLPGAFSYGGYRLECALRSATLLGVFGLGGLGTELRLSLQSLQFHELWTGLWLLLAVMLSLEALLRALRHRWGMPSRFKLTTAGVGRSGRELLLALLGLLPVLVLVAMALEISPAQLLAWQPLPPLQANWPAVLALPWAALVATTLGLTLLAACLAVGVAPLLLLLVAPWPWGRLLLRAVWAMGRLWPPPLTALLLLFVLKPGVITAALALAFHNLGVLGRLLLEACEDTADQPGSGGAEVALSCSGCGPRLALLYGRFSGLARSYLAYGAYRADVILRETVVVGLVGAAGLGSLLLEALSSFAVDELIALIAVYALLTLLGEDLSDRVRQRLLSG